VYLGRFAVVFADVVGGRTAVVVLVCVWVAIASVVTVINLGKKMKRSAFELGKKYFIRTATYHVVGQLNEIYTNELVLSSASWIADSGRFNAALTSGNFEEIEPFVNDVIVSRGGIIDATEWTHILPTKVK